MNFIDLYNFIQTVSLSAILYIPRIVQIEANAKIAVIPIKICLTTLIVR